jgi:hypothetical protein
LQIHAGRPEKSFATRHVPDVVQPGELSERIPLVVDEGCRGFALAGFEQHDLDAFLAQLVRERTATGAGADDDHHGIVIEFELCHDAFLSCVRLTGDQAL